MKPSISLEFFPPRSAAQEAQFWTTLKKLESLKPTYLSMTWGALGSSSKASLDILKPLVQRTDIPLTAHLTCAAQTDASARESIQAIEKLGITRFLALRGDAGGTENTSEHLQHASDLVSILAEETSRQISVAAYPEAHPESPDAHHDLKWLKNKLDAGASSAITQFFFEADTFLRFRDAAVSMGISQKLVPGILPIHDIAKVQSFSKKCGAGVPDALIERFSTAVTAEEKSRLAVEHCVELCQALQQEGVEEYHLYTLNQADLCSRVCHAWLGKGEGVTAAA